MSKQPLAKRVSMEVLREMIRLAEDRRAEELRDLERVNKYNLALIGFSGSFLSLLVTIDFPVNLRQIAGALLILSIIFSLLAIAPRRLFGGSILLEDDIEHLRKGQSIDQTSFFLETVTVIEGAATALTKRAREKKRLTMISAVFLATSLIITYILIAYA